MTDISSTPRPETHGETHGQFLVAALYHFASFPRFADFREPLQAVCDENGVKGTLLLAHEGINGTIAGTDAGIAVVLALLRAQPELAALGTRKAAHPPCLSCA